MYLSSWLNNLYRKNKKATNFTLGIYKKVFLIANQLRKEDLVVFTNSRLGSQVCSVNNGVTLIQSDLTSRTRPVITPEDEPETAEPTPHASIYTIHNIPLHT